MKHRQHASQQDARWLLQAQAWCLMGGLVLWYLQSPLSAVSFEMGVLACLIPTSRFYRRFFGLFGVSQAKAMMRTLYGHVAYKTLWMVVVFTVFLQWSNAQPMWLLLGYLCTQSMGWLLPIKWAIQKDDYRH